LDRGHLGLLGRRERLAARLKRVLLVVERLELRLIALGGDG